MLLEQYKEAIENSNIVSKTDTNGFITFVNDEFCKISGYTREELIGKNHNIVRHPDVPKSNFRRLWSTIKSKKTFKATVRNQAKDGSDFYLNTTITPILNTNGDIEEFIAIRYDVTKEIELQLALEEKQKILFMQSRFASLGQMIANIAHQWRQPLAELNWVLFSLKNALLKNNPVEIEKSYIDAQNIIANMSNTIEDFSNFFNPNKKKSLFFIKNSIEDSIHILSKNLSEENITIEKKFIDVQVEGISNELSQVVINLLQNAKDAFVINQIKNRTIKISIAKIEIKPKKSCAKITIEDNAGGIDENHIDKIFEPYFSTKHASIGTGIGLFISNMIIKNSLNGIITVENGYDGAKFTITIPIKVE